MVSLEVALQILIDGCRHCRVVRLPLAKSSGRVLAEDITCDMDFPPFDRSPLDGYAVRKEDIRRATPKQPVSLKQIDYVPAGTWPERRVGAGEAVRIMTGAKIPDGADAVV